MNALVAFLGKLLAYAIPAWFKAKDEQKQRDHEAIELEDSPHYKKWSEGEIL